MLNIRRFVFVIFYFSQALKDKEKSACYFFYLKKEEDILTFYIPQKIYNKS